MPDHTLTFTPEELAKLERVRSRLGMASIEAAALAVIQRRLQRKAQELVGRGRALYLVRKQPKGAV